MGCCYSRVENTEARLAVATGALHTWKLLSRSRMLLPKRSRPIDRGWQKERSAHALPGPCTPEFQLQRPPLLSEALTLLKSMSELSGYLFAKNLPAGRIRTANLPRASFRVWRRQVIVMPSSHPGGTSCGTSTSGVVEEAHALTRQGEGSREVGSR